MTNTHNRIRPGEPIAPPFTPVPMLRNRHDGWTPERQHAFLVALSVVGVVEVAAKMTGISRKSAYALRAREDAKSFARAWDVAVADGRARIFDYMMDRALNGSTTIRIKMGGAVEISQGRDGQLLSSQLHATQPGANSFRQRLRAGSGQDES